MKTICAIGGAAMDIISKIAQADHTLGNSQKGSVEMVPGGSLRNAVECLCRLGLNEAISFVTCIARDQVGELLISSFKSLGLVVVSIGHLLSDFQGEPALGYFLGLFGFFRPVSDRGRGYGNSRDDRQRYHSKLWFFKHWNFAVRLQSWPRNHLGHFAKSFRCPSCDLWAYKQWKVWKNTIESCTCSVYDYKTQFDLIVSFSEHHVKRNSIQRIGS